jgi:protein translocase SecG subunit
MSILISALFILTALLLIGTVLIQQPKTAGGLFSGTGQSLLGTSGKTFWTKFTTVLAVVFMALCLLQAALPRFQQSSSSVADTIEKQQQAASQAQPAAAPPAQSAPQAQPAPQKAPESKGAVPGSANKK